MRGGDVLTDALNYALDQIGGPKAPVAVLNASGYEEKSFVKQSNHICNNYLYTLNSVFNTILIRATRQKDETLGLVATAMGQIAAGGSIVIAQENAHGADGLEKRLEEAFTDVTTIIKHKCRVMVLKPESANAGTIAGWQKAAALQKVAATGLWSQPGLFSWDRFDVGSKLLLSNLPEKLVGNGADLGCGYGFLSVNLVKKDGVTGLYSMDNDNRAVEACTRNLSENGTTIPTHVFWRDATVPHADIPKLDWVVMNPPFHTQQFEDRELGQKFCNSALKMLKSGGKLYLVANRHMPYEVLLDKAAKKVTLLTDKDGFKILCAQAA
jgi:16S rRNA (guanine1207-N2)-methyltransferase